MKRTERILKHARHEGWMCALCISVAVASGVWAAVAWMNGRGPGGALLGFGAIAAFRLASWHGRERRRLIGKVLPTERVWNPTPERTATRRDESDFVLWVALAVAMGVPAIAAAVHLFWKFSCN